jgi:hypothetical protein
MSVLILVGRLQNIWESKNKRMKLTVSKSYVDPKGRVMAVTMPMPEVPKNVCFKCRGKGWVTGAEWPCVVCNPGGDFRSTRTAHERYHSSLQQVKDTSVVYEDEIQAGKMLLISQCISWNESLENISPTVKQYLKEGFYDHDTIEVEILDVDTVEDGGGCFVAGSKSVARILPIVEKPAPTKLELFLQERISDLYRAIEFPGGPASQNYPFDEHNKDGLIGMKRAYSDVLTSIKSESLIEQSDWDTVLTDAIEETQGSIKPYSRILKYLSDKYTITRKPLPSPPKP